MVTISARKEYRRAFAPLFRSPTSSSWICPPCLARIEAHGSKRTMSGGGAQRHQATHEHNDTATNSPSMPLYATRRTPSDVSHNQLKTIKYLRELAKPQNPGFRKSKQSTIIAGANDLSANTEAQIYALQDALRRRCTVSVLRLLEDGEGGQGLVTSIPRTTWTEILRLLEPSLLTRSLHKLHRSFNTARLWRASFFFSESVNKTAENVVRLLRLRQDNGIPAGFMEYRILLKHTASRGDASLAKVLWSEMTRNGIQPDLVCYNAYMNAIVWNEDSRIEWGAGMHKVRSGKKPVANEVSLFEEGVSDEIKPIFAEMQQAQIMPDTDSFCAYMIAIGRDGRLDEVERILADVFHIDVDALMQGAGDTIETLPSNPLIQHNNKLLSSVAQIYGQANQIPKALSIIDYIANTYQVRVTGGVWYELARWSWIQIRLTRHQNPQSQAHYGSVVALGDMMTSPPYNVHLRMDVLDILFRSVAGEHAPVNDQRRFPTLLKYLELGRLEYIRYIKRYRDKADQLRKLGSRKNYELASSSSQSRGADFHVANQVMRSYQITKRMAHITLSRWARKMIKMENSNLIFDQPTNETLLWVRVGLPHFVGSWEAFLPNVISYHVGTGIATLQIRTEEEVQEQARRKGQVESRKAFNWTNSSGSTQPWEKRFYAGKGRRRGEASKDTLMDIMSPPKGKTGTLMFDRSYG